MPRLSGISCRGFDGPVQLGVEDHRLQKGVDVSRWQRVSDAYPVAAEGTGYTFAQCAISTPQSTVTP